MPSKIQLDENLWFLFICLQKSDYKTIDFNAVGKVTNLNPPAARMRFTRLRRQIGGSISAGVGGTTYSGASNRPAILVGKRKISDEDPLTSKRRGRMSKVQIKAEYRKSSDEYETDSSECLDSEDDMPLAKKKQERQQGRSFIEKTRSFTAFPENPISQKTSQPGGKNGYMIQQLESCFCPKQTTIGHENVASIEKPTGGQS